jgi:hypothetical protein
VTYNFPFAANNNNVLQRVSISGRGHEVMALSHPVVRIAASLLLPAAFLTSATAQQNPLSAKARAAKFGLSDIRGIAYHPGPPLRGCASTVAHKCEMESGYKPLPVDPKFGKYPLPFFLDSLSTYDTQGNKVQDLKQDYTIYYDADFYNKDFQALWGPREGNGPWRRDDLARFHYQLGANFVHLYDWNPVETSRDHGPFLDYAAKLGMRVTVPISNDTLRIMCLPPNQRKSWENWENNVTQVFNTIYKNGTTPHAAAGVLKIFNEFNVSQCKNPDYVAEVAYKWKQLEDSRVVNGQTQTVPDGQRLPIIFPVTFGDSNGFPGGDVTLAFKAIIKKFGNQDGLAFWQQRVIYATNPFTKGDFALKWLGDLPAKLKNNGIPPDTPVMFTEYGTDKYGDWKDEDAQAAFVKSQFESVYLTNGKYLKPGNFLGAAAFISNYRHWWSGDEPLYGLMNYRQVGRAGRWGSEPSNPRNETVEYWNPIGQARWSATYQVEIQRPRKAYCAIMNVFWRSGTFQPPTCP